MKNIHVLPTEKSSRLFVYDGKLGLAKGFQYGSDAIQNHNIYITSDEEIKEGDWFLDDNNSIGQSYKLSHVQFANPNKIILTTDFGKQPRVQAIDDEFLEWFIKNPSCEEVDWFYSSLMKDYEYKIIIPKEEDCSCTDECLGYLTKSCKRIEEPKKETLEEFIQRQLSLGKYQDQESAIKYSILASVKWQQKRMYSDEEVYDILIHHTIELFKKEKITLEDFWNKFKKNKIWD